MLLSSEEEYDVPLAVLWLRSSIRFSSFHWEMIQNGGRGAFILCKNQTVCDTSGDL